LKEKTVELVSGATLTGEWVDKDGKAMRENRSSKPYVNHHEIQHDGIYLKINDVITFVEKKEILVIRNAYKRET